MARIALLNVAAHGHVNPTLPVVRELVQRGHQVFYYLTGEEFREKIEAVGGDYRPLEIVTDYDHSKPARTLIHLAAFLLEYGCIYVPTLLDEFSREKIDLVIADTLALPGRVAARTARLPYVCFSSSVAMHKAMLRSSAPPAKLLRVLALGGPAYLRFRKHARELKRKYGAADLSVFDTLTNHGDLTVVFTIKDIQPMHEELDESYVFVGPSIRDANLESGDIDFEALTGDRLIFVSLGTRGNFAPKFYRSCMRAFGNSQHSVIMSIGNRLSIDSLGPIPSNFVVRQYVNQLKVLEHADVFITHGGNNSIHEGLYQGVPLVMYPVMQNDAIACQSIAAKGAGILLKGSDLTPQRLQTLVQGVLDEDRFANSAKSLSQALRAAGGPSQAADAVVEVYQRARADRENREV